MRVHSLILDKNINNIEVLPLSDLHVGDAAVMGCPVIELSGTEHKVVVTMGRI